MRPLISLQPIRHPELGVESFASFLRRLADVYDVSLHQLLRYLCESREVSELVGEGPFRLSAGAPDVLNGYADLGRKFIRRVEAATGVQRVGATTLQRIGPALAKNSVLAMAKERRYCPLCLIEMKNTDGVIWEPLHWSLSTLACCVVHDVALQFSESKWLDLKFPDEIEWSSHFSLRNEESYTKWLCEESLKLLRFCVVDPEDFVREDAIRLFLNTYMRSNHLELADFCQITGLPYGNLKRQTAGTLGFTLKTIFNIAQRLALSPVDIFADPIGIARQNVLFSVADHAHEVEASTVPVSHPHHSTQVRDELLFVIQALLASSQPLPPLAHVCHARGLSTGFARYRLPIEVKEFLKRRRRERSEGRLIRRSEATQVANEALRDSEGVGNLKRTEEKLRKQTGLPKHLLLPALRTAAEKSIKYLP